MHDREGQKIMGFQIVEISTPASVAVAAAAAAPQGATLRQLAAEGNVDLIGPGDILSVNIFEVGAGLFSGGGATSLGNDMGTAESAGVNGVVVDRDGAITLPYVGRLIVAGHTATEVQAMIQRAMRGMSQSPQALVAVRQNVTNTVLVLGVVSRPGRQSLTLNRSRLLDAIADAGGTGLQRQEDMIVRFTRGGRSIEQLLSLINTGSPDDLVLLPGDRIQVIRRPQTYTVFGATKVSQVNFDNPALTLAEAMARAGGPADDRADPSAVFVFRYARAEDGTPVVPKPGDAGTPPTIYRIDMMRPASYFLAQNFMMRDKDVLYMANAAANRPSKLVNIVNQLFSPLVTAKILLDNNP
ncbi:polysaccharide biosynthesis/export family protein [Sphingomonas sp. AP4-R1]|uniref:polysaccharide biosynthesis/export family protein n=1 Tax=Sphingomonas sp. AP4-R1 TaxID=2735134 RepID=UPI0020A54897|nr:polysaccharide biosynthesis/export family protein [Sphingomonas sp. AP4-R1]